MEKHSSFEGGQKSGAQDFFLYLLVFLSMSFVAFGEGNILFEFINKFVADADKSLPASFDQGSVKFGIATLFIAGPIFFIVSKIISARISTKKTSLESPVRRWLTYIVLFFSASTIIGDLIALVMNFLNGEYTSSFLLKVLVVLAVAGSIFGYYFWEMRRSVLTSVIIKNSAVFVMAILGATFVAAFFVIDSPTVAREKRIDQQAVDSLQSVDSSIRSYFSQSGKLPEKLDDLEKSGFQPFVQNVNLVKYEKKNGNEYKLCANFVRDNLSDQQNTFNGHAQKEWNHGKGDACFDRVALDKVGDPATIK